MIFLFFRDKILIYCPFFKKNSINEDFFFFGFETGGEVTSMRK